MIMATFSERLKQRRKEKGLTHQQMAEELKINRVTYTNWENGKREPELVKVTEIAGILNCTVDYLLGTADINVLDYTKENLLKMSVDELQGYQEELIKNLEVIKRTAIEKFQMSEQEFNACLYFGVRECIRQNRQSDIEAEGR